MYLTVGMVTGCRDIPPYVIMTPSSFKCLINPVELFPPTQLRANEGGVYSCNKEN